MVKMTTATTGTGTITLGSASSGYQSFADAYGANATVDVLIADGTAWEVARNCTYTHSGTTLTRGTLEDSSTGSALNLSGSATVSVVATAAFGNRTEMALQAITPGGRLTTESGVPVSTSDRTAQSTLYYTPYVHNIINLWDGAEWKPITFTEYTLALGTLTSGKPYDVFAYLNAGALALEVLVWTSDLVRATAVTLQDGRYCKSGDKTRLLLGTFYTTSSTETADSKRQRLVGNVYNNVSRGLYYASGAASHSYSSGTRRYWNDTSVSRLEIVHPLGGGVNGSITSNVTGTAPRVEMSLNGITSGDFFAVVEINGTAGSQNTASANTVLVAGFNFIAAVEVSASGGTYDYLAITGFITQ